MFALFHVFVPTSRPPPSFSTTSPPANPCPFSAIKASTSAWRYFVSPSGTVIVQVSPNAAVAAKRAIAIKFFFMRHRSSSLKLCIFYHDIPRLASRQTATVFG